MNEKRSLREDANKRQTGARYEKLAGAFLEENGCQILEYNYYFRGGEIDLF